WEWYSCQPWLCGFNYIPRTAVNWTDFWQEEGFAEDIVRQELGWAKAIGFNALRTNLQFWVWRRDGAKYLQRISRFLQIAEDSGLKSVFCLFDDCAFSGDEPFWGRQKPPRPMVHNSQAAASPGRGVVCDRRFWPELRDYVGEVVGHFADDQRVLVWDLYNEPGNRGIFVSETEEAFYSERLEYYAGQLLTEVFGWARRANPSQPLTTGGWRVNRAENFSPRTDAFVHPIDRWALANSDVISFHAYCRLDQMRALVEELKGYSRPLLCTEWLARHIGCTFGDIVRYFAGERIGCFQWGLVNGLTQTHLPWPGVRKDNPAGWDRVWFHDFLRPDGSAYSGEEAATLSQLRCELSGEG
ncbi:MAG: 1,4-beta-xylanase, partial [Negativicutes bacterium]|nr:1,4-beta-xylanase [Negativicutes bacterium]